MWNTILAHDVNNIILWLETRDTPELLCRNTNFVCWGKEQLQNIIFNYLHKSAHGIYGQLKCDGCRDSI